MKNAITEAYRPIRHYTALGLGNVNLFIFCLLEMLLTYQFFTAVNMGAWTVGALKQKSGFVLALGEHLTLVEVNLLQ